MGKITEFNTHMTPVLEVASSPQIKQRKNFFITSVHTSAGDSSVNELTCFMILKESQTAKATIISAIAP